MNYKNLLTKLLPRAGASYLKLSLKLMMIGQLFFHGAGYAEDYFDPDLLLTSHQGNTEKIDLSQFEKESSLAEGTYLVDVIVNTAWVSSEMVLFKISHPDGKLTAQLNREQLDRWGVNTDSNDALTALKRGEYIDDLSRIIPGATIHFEQQKLKLDIEIPQIAMKSSSYTQLPEVDKWDDGIPALLFNYMFSGMKSNSAFANRHAKMHSLFLSANGGANLGPWRLRSSIAWSQQANSPIFSNRYIARDLQNLKSELTVGETWTQNDILDSVNFTGLKLKTSDDMIPDNQRGFSPVISGVATSRAQVSIYQNHNLIYQTSVAAGAFRLTDLPQTTNSGELTVVVREANGNTQQWVQPYTGLPIMQRNGHGEYEFAIGRAIFDYYNRDIRPTFGQGTFIYGLPANTTGYGGTLLSRKYAAMTAGAGVSLGDLGAVSIDNAWSHAIESHNPTVSGNAWRLKYSKNLLTTGTTIDISDFRYASRGYMSFMDSQSVSPLMGSQIIGYRNNKHRRNSQQIILRQNFSHWGNLNLSAIHEDYWDSDEKDNRFSLGYGTSIGAASLSMNIAVNKNQFTMPGPKNYCEVSFNISIPLDAFSSDSNSHYGNLSYQTIRDGRGKFSHMGSLSGMLNDNWNYEFGQSTSQGQDAITTLNMGYDGSTGNTQFAYDWSHHQQTMSASATGGVVIHPWGVTLAPFLGESIALIRAPGASGVHIVNTHENTDWRGYAVIPSLINYRYNAINLDPDGLDSHVMLTETGRRVVPTKGAVVVAEYPVRTGRQAIITLHYRQGTVPFGAMVSLATDHNKGVAGIVGDNGEVYLSGLTEEGYLRVIWGRDVNKQCSTYFKLPQDSHRYLDELTLTCHQPSQPTR
ncbi:fimbria/pilus outer membrane usher protein [Escherichia coli]|nr:fimbria/pilus outer membrane usher protein [Escherichia coli]